MQFLLKGAMWLCIISILAGVVGFFFIGYMLASGYATLGEPWLRNLLDLDILLFVAPAVVKFMFFKDG